jgi:predicted kinase
MHNGNFGDRFPVLILLSGLPGSGKTTFAHQLQRRIDADHVESDAVRRSIAPAPLYSHAESGAVFARVDAAARKSLFEGRHVIVDATNLTNRDRRRFLRMVAELGVRLVAIRLTAPETVIRERLAGPRDGHSQAGLDIYERMRDRPQPLPVPCIVVDTRFSLAPAIDLVLHLIDDREL